MFNSDGWGIMYANNGKIHTHKGMDVYTLLNSIKTLPISLEYFVHLRMATHGEVSIAMCHPFKVTNDLYLMHNGIISALADKKSSVKSDTALFTELFKKDINSQSELIFESSVIDNITNYVGSGNRLVFLHSSGKHVIINRQDGISYQGLWCSNTYAWDLWNDKQFYLEYENGENDFIDCEDIHKLNLTQLKQLDYDSLLSLIYDFPDEVAAAIKFSR
jgi:glutamine amidotransferase